MGELNTLKEIVALKSLYQKHMIEFQKSTLLGCQNKK